jgi:tetratricopeptide (TPR) repeat protein
LDKRQLSRAESLLAQLARRRPPTANDVRLRAELELRRGRLDLAVRPLAEIPETDPDAASARLRAGQIEKRRDRARRMEARFREALRLDPKLALAHRELILLYAMQARRADLNAQYRALSALEPLTCEDALFWTASLEDIWINETIQTQLDRYLAADPDDRSSRLALADLSARSNELDEAEAILHPLPETDPDAQAVRARLALRRMIADQVRSMLDRARTDHPGLALLRGELAIRVNDPPTAARQFRTALRLDPTNREALQGLSLVLQQLGQAGQAAHYRRRVQDWRALKDLLETAKDQHQSRTDQSFLRALGEACEKVGRPAEARAWYQLALALDPLDARVQQSLNRLRVLPPSDRPRPGKSPAEALQAGTDKTPW